MLSAGTQWRDPQGKPYCDRQFILDFCNLVQGWSHDVLDVAARFHAKSLIKTTSLTIQQILNDPEVTIAIVSNTLGQAKDFLFQIKSEIESNSLLRTLSYDWSLGGQIFWENPKNEAPRWSLQEGFVVNRKSKPKESTIEAIGLMEGIKPGPHFGVLNYDDAVTPESVSTSDQIEKTNRAWSMSLNYGQPGTQRIYTGTFYAFGDTYHEMMRRGVELRLQPAFEVKELETDSVTGHIKKLDWNMDKTVLYTHEELESVVGGMRPREYGTQILCFPQAGEEQGFDEDWILYYKRLPHEESRGKNVYILVDPAAAKKKDSSYTVMWVVGVGSDQNYYVLDGIRDRMNLGEKADALFMLHRKWSPLEVRYEKYSMQSDIQHIKDRMERESYRFRIREVGGSTAKDDRIARLVPLFANGRFFLPKSLRKTRTDGTRYDLVSEFINDEYIRWPTCETKDMLDALARIDEPDAPIVWPKPTKDSSGRYEEEMTIQRGSWMVASYVIMGLSCLFI